jgi:hypothetical protein
MSTAVPALAFVRAFFLLGSEMYSVTETFVRKMSR